jgi:hypothetical protein
MNASGRKGKQYMDYRKAYLDEIGRNNEADVIFLPGDEPAMWSSVTENEFVKKYEMIWHSQLRFR